MSKLRRVPKGNRSAAPKPASADIRQLKAAQKLMDNDEFEEAYELLIELEKSAPNDTVLLDLLHHCAFEIDELRTLMRASSKLTELVPDDPEPHVDLAIALGDNGYPAHAVTYLREAFERWPDNEFVSTNESFLDDFSSSLEPVLASIPLPHDKALEFQMEFETARLLMRDGDIIGAKAIADSLVERYPNIARPHALMSAIYGGSADYEEAFEYAVSAVELNPNDDFTLLCLVRISFFTGRLDDAFEFARRLKDRIGQPDANHLLIAEAQILVGDYEAVIKACHTASKSTAYNIIEAGLCHYQALAEYNLGRLPRAKKLWKKALDIEPEFEIAAENLENAMLHKAARHGAVPFSSNYWYSERCAASLNHLTAKKHFGSSTHPEIARKVLDDNPELIVALPLILDHADPQTVQLLLLLASLSGDPRFAGPFKGFLSSERGNVLLRLMIESYLRDEAVDDTTEVKVPIGSTVYTVYDHVKEKNISEAAMNACMLAYNNLLDDKEKEGEKYSRYATQLAPQDPWPLNLLETSLRRQGRE